MGSLAGALLLLGVVFSAGAQAAPGDLDLTFSGDGKQTTNFGGSEGANAVALQANGKIVAVGSAGPFPDDFALARYNTNGSLDTSFSGDGRQTTDFGGFDRATGVALQGDGKIVAVGVTDPSPSGTEGAFALARYNPNGSLDTSFSGDGMETTDFGSGVDEATGVALQRNGKIVVVGNGGPGGADDFALARYNPNGTLDTSFSGDGMQTTDFFGGFDQATGVALQANGKIVAVGGGTGDLDFALARYNPNGSLDTSFSGDGKQTTDFGGRSATGVALQANGKIVAVGGSDFALARYNPNGTLDTSFSGDGRQTTNFGGSDFANGVALTPHGKIVLVGGGGPNHNFALARYNPNGSLDTSFSGDGKLTTDFGFAGSDAAHGVVLQKNGKIVAAGVGRGPSQSTDFALARYLGS